MANGTNTTLNYSGMLNVDGSTQSATGGLASGPNGNGGSATLNASGNIFKPLGPTFQFSATSTGANGVGTGNGGSATTNVNGNIVNASIALTSIELDSIALAGTGVKYGNATATLSGNVVNYTNAAATNVKLLAQASANGADTTTNNGNLNFGTKKATVSGNVVGGNINNFTLEADAFWSNATATISGNIFNSKPANTGTVLVKAEGQTSSITGNILNLGKQNVTLELDQLGPTYKSTIAGNIFNGTGTNVLTLLETQTPAGPSFDSAIYNVGNHTLTFNGQSNIVNNFSGFAVAGTANATYVGTSGNDTLNAGSSTTTGTIIFQGNGGNDTITGGPTALNVAQFAGAYWQYTTANLSSVIGGPVGNTTNTAMSGIQRVKFLAPSDVGDIDSNGYGDLILYNTGTGALQVTEMPGVVTQTETVLTPGFNAIATGQFTPDSSRNVSLLLQNTTNGQMEIASALSTGTQTITPLTGATVGLVTPTTFTGWTAITTGDFNGDAAADILLQQGSGGPVEIAFLNTIAGQAIGTVNAISAVTSPSGTGWNAIASCDFNADGNDDILWYNGTSGAVDISLMTGPSGTPTSIGTSPSGFAAIASGDFNDDGKSDVLFYNSTTHQADIWLMNGTTMIADSGPINAPTLPADTYTLKGAEDVNKDGFSDLLWTGSLGNVVGTEMTGTSNTVSVLNQNVPLGTIPAGFQLVASTG